MHRNQPRPPLQIVTQPRHALRRFHQLAEQYFEQTFARFPTYASHLGRKEFEPFLGHPTARTYQQHADLLRRTLAAVENLPARNFTADAWLDRRAFLSELRQEWMFTADLHRWRTNPEAYASTAVESIYHLVVKNADRLATVAPSIESRLRRIPSYLQEAAATIRRPVPLWTRLARQTCAGVPPFFRSLAEPLTAATHQPAPHWADLLERAAAAFDRFADAVAAKPPGPRTGYAIGRARFEYLIRERLGLDLSAREAEAVGLQLVARLQDELRREARRFSPNRSARDILEEAARQWRPRAPDLLSEYQRVAAEVRDRFREARAMSFPEHDQLLIKPVPDFLRHQFPTAAYWAPGPYERRQVGIFWVNDLSVTKRTEAEKQREIGQHFGIELTAAHEAYPGHHLQFLLQNRHPSRWRRLFAHSIFYEGWTLWVEQMTVDLNVARSPYARLQQLHDALWRAHRILVDCGLHTGRMDHVAASRHLQRHLGFTEARARGDVNWYTLAPTVPMSYLLGKCELLRLKRQRVQEGGWSLRRFNDWVLGFGALPWSWIEASRL